ncbi:glycosyltransferase family 9 protein [Mucilaginibacter sp. SG564]|uniref:glycosyltransferase family 9 protein n=2 Tax=unclassified Mucilaginibacter TaxID=2617802 RepID=UPI001556158C|nr:glycosyltransferase family 9 protein [Mucilaginibacter sp. SG564]
MLKQFIFLVYVVKTKIRHLFSPEKVSDRLLILKMDAIGDYIIFRNFLREIAYSEKYKQCKITVICDKALKELALELDGDVIDNVISFDLQPFLKNKIDILKQAAVCKYRAVINFHYSRTPETEIITWLTAADEKVTIDGDTLRMSFWKKPIFNLIYNKLFIMPSDIKSEFGFNKALTEFITGVKSHIEGPSLELDADRYDSKIEGPYLIVAPGAGSVNRQLRLSSYAKIVDFLIDKGYNVCFIGSPKDSLIVGEIINSLPHGHLNKITDLSGKTALGEMPYIINKSLGVICNDSGPYHLSMALNKATICLAGGGHFERFVSYGNSKKVKLCYELMPCFNCNWQCIYKFNATDPYPCLDAIDINKVFENISLLEKEYMI